MIVCPKCRSRNTAPIVYGFPSTDLLEEAEQDKVILGGCDITDCQDDYGCCDCGFQWSRERLDIKYVNRITIMIWHKALSRHGEIKKHVYEILPDGKVKYYICEDNTQQSAESKECNVYVEVVNKLYKEIQNIISLNKRMLTLNVRHGAAYSLTISYKDNRSTDIEGCVVGYPLDVLLTEFIDNLKF